MDADSMKDLAFAIKDACPTFFLVLAAENKGKANILVMLSQDLIEQKSMHAGNIIRELAKEVKGGGGGQPHIATAGGSDPSGISRLLEKGRTFLS